MSSATKKIVLKKLKELDTIWHPESTCVFKSTQDKVVIGRFENGELVSLDDTALDLCEKWKFKYDTSLIEEEEGEEEADDEGGNANEDSDTKEDSIQNDEESEVETVQTPPPPQIVTQPVKAPVVRDDKLPISSTKEINSIMIDANARLNSYFTSLISDFTKKIDLLEIQLADKNSELTVVSQQLAESSAQLTELNTQHTKLQSKFEGIKQLFS
jgi:hypothetical protein